MNWDWDKLNARKPQGPWGSGGSGGSGDGPDLNKLKESLQQFKLPGGKLAIIVLVVIWLLTGLYEVGPAQVGVVQRFGAFHRVTEPGLHYHIPYPIEKVQKPDVEGFRRVEVGFQTLLAGGQFQQGKIRPVLAESLMLTGDENIVDVQFIVQYRISNAQFYLFNVQDQDNTVKHVAEAAMREVVGYNRIDAVLTDQKEAIQIETQTLMQEVLNRYQAGIVVEAVQLQDVHPPEAVADDFKDVASAREDKNRLVNEAQAYRNDILPRARGLAARIINEASALRDQTVRRAKGEAARFDAVLEEYIKAPDITRDRLQIESMERILANPNLSKLLLSESAGNSTVPYLQLAPPEVISPSAKDAAQGIRDAMRQATGGAQ